MRQSPYGSGLIMDWSRRRSNARVMERAHLMPRCLDLGSYIASRTTRLNSKDSCHHIIAMTVSIDDLHDRFGRRTALSETAGL